MSQSSSRDSYILDRGPTDRARLTRMARAGADLNRELCRRAGLRPGDRAIDVGCGPLGALPVLAELVGPAGAVVGLDVSADALARAGRALAELGIGNVTLVEADVNTVDPAAVCPPGPFDLAVCRSLLAHQADPAATLRRMAALLRPGGRIAARDLLDDGRSPWVDPPVPAVARWRELHVAAMRRAGASPDAARRYPALCAAARLRLLGQQGDFSGGDPETLAFVRDTLLAARRSLVGQGLATDDEIDRLAGELDAADARGVRFAASPLFVQMIAEAP